MDRFSIYPIFMDREMPYWDEICWKRYSLCSIAELTQKYVFIEGIVSTYRAYLTRLSYVEFTKGVAIEMLLVSVGNWVWLLNSALSCFFVRLFL